MSRHTVWSSFVSGASSRAEILEYLLESGQSLLANRAVPGAFLDIGAAGMALGKVLVCANCCKLCPSMGQELGCASLGGQGSLICWYGCILSTLIYLSAAGWVENLKIAALWPGT